MGVKEEAISRPSGAKAPEAEKIPAADLEALGLPVDATREQLLDRARKLDVVARGLRRQSAAPVVDAGRVHATATRTPELDADPKLVWTGTHYQEIA